MKVFLLSYVLNCVMNDILDGPHVLNDVHVVHVVHVGHVVHDVDVVHVGHVVHVSNVINTCSILLDLGVLRVPQSMQPWQDGTDRSHPSECPDY